MDSNCRPKFSSFELYCLKFGQFLSIFTRLREETHDTIFQRKNISKIPVDNGSSLNKLITLKIIALTNITLIEKSVLAVYP
jgi:hypothetical protein